MNGVTPNLLEKFSRGFIFYVLSLAQTIFIHLFSQVVSYDLFFSMFTQGRGAINSEEASSIFQELDIF